MSAIRKHIALFAFVALFACAAIPLVIYAYVTIDSTPDAGASNGANHQPAYKTTVFTTNMIGYYFYADSDQVCGYSKTLDGGYTWGAQVDIGACDGAPDIWYDQWTPGDTTGTKIYIAILEDGTDDMFYSELDTSNDSLSTALNITNGNQLTANGINEGQNFPTVTKATNGVLYAGTLDSNDQFVLECSSSCTSNISQWTEVGTGTTVFSGLTDEDSLLLLPLASGNILAIAHDAGDDDYKSKVWSDGGSAWDVAWANIDTSAVDDSLFTPHMAATLNKSTNDIYFAYLADPDKSSPTNNTADVRTALYSGGSWSAKTNVATNVGSTTDAVGIAFDMTNNRVFVAFQMAEDIPKQTRPIYSLFYKTSNDAMTTWSATSGPIGEYSPPSGGVFAYDVYGLGLNMMSSFKIFATWFNDTSDDILGVLVEDRLAYNTESRLTFNGNVKFNGSLNIEGALSKLAGTFVIDHPLKPFTHLLYHSFVESPDAKNIYDGVATLDENGEVTVALPDYFEALNKDFRYQFFPHGEPMPNLYVKEEVVDNTFVIAGGVPDGEITWQVTGTRHDPYIVANPIRNTVPKGPNEEVDVGECLFEPLCR
jgi:hypothetical protein